MAWLLIGTLRQGCPQTHLEWANAQRTPSQLCVGKFPQGPILFSGIRSQRRKSGEYCLRDPENEEHVLWDLTGLVPFWAPLLTGSMMLEQDDTHGGRGRRNSPILCIYIYVA